MGYCLDMEYYLPVLAMVLTQFIYSVFIVYRHAFATILLAPIAYLSGRNSRSYSLNLTSFSWIFMTSLIGITLYQNLYFEGLYLSSSSTATAMINLTPAVTFVIATFVGMEKVNIQSLRTIAKIVGTMICVTGAVSLSMTLLKGPKLLNADHKMPSKTMMTTTLESDENWLIGCLFLLGSSVAGSIWLILQVPAYASHPNYISLSAWMCLISTLQSSILTLFLEPDLNAWKINSLLQFGCTLYAGIMGSAFVFCLQAWCITKRGPLFSAMFNPLLTVIVTILAACAIGVIIGLYTVLWGKAEDVKEMINSKLVVNETTEVTFSTNESCEKSSCKIDLEEHLLADKSTSRCGYK
ncbi:nodulin MtN21/EamA-like transporter family protein [Medicago truncatula]|uniref:WAT1-related protein n=1 Tax=Medicago truncatula TaxID=3880 RepID=G7LBK6_MEDTR|nr:nodulin MtN21/EamA-like transporter family protein [Medicago truncatula]